MTHIKDKSFIFIIGAPRSGTTWLQTMIGAHPQVSTTIETTLYERYTAPWIEAWEWENENNHRPGLFLYWSEDEFYDFLRLFLDKVYERIIADNPNATHILDKRPANSAFVAQIQRLIPQARFIHVIRDGRDVAVSMMAAARDMWFKTDNVEKAATKWQEKLLQARQAEQFTGQYIEVRYEALLNDGVNTMQKVFEFCDLPVEAEQVAKIVDDHAFDKLQASRKSPAEGIKMPEKFYRKGKAGSWQEELATAEQRQTFDQIAGALLRDLGYAQDGWAS